MATLKGKEGDYDAHSYSADSEDTVSQNEHDSFLHNNNKLEAGSQRQRLRQNASSVGHVFTCCILTLVVGLLAGFFGARWTSTSTGKVTTTERAKILLEAGVTNPKTPIPKHILTNRKNVPFIPHREFMGPSDEAAKNWKMLTAASDSIYLPEPAHYNLSDPGIRAPFFIFNDPPPRAAQDTANLHNFYVLSNLHSLHCVHMIRMRYNMLVYPSSKPVHPLNASSPIDVDWIDHMEHCFEYLRLTATCGDHLVFESDSPPGSPREYWEGGLSWGVVHSCIDWDGLMGWQEKMVGEYNKTWMG